MLDKIQSLLQIAFSIISSLLPCKKLPTLPPSHPTPKHKHEGNISFPGDSSYKEVNDLSGNIKLSGQKKKTTSNKMVLNVS